jgi:hypothetical protein
MVQRALDAAAFNSHAHHVRFVRRRITALPSSASRFVSAASWNGPQRVAHRLLVRRRKS